MVLPILLAFLFLNTLGLGGYGGHVAYGNAGEDHAGQPPATVPAATPSEAGKDWVEEKLGGFVPLSAGFTDENGTEVVLADIIDKPTIVIPVYFYCPSSCSQNLANLAVSIKQLKARPGKDFRVIAISFNEEETTDDAARAKRNYLKLAGESFPEREWQFLTGTREAITALTSALGYRFQKMPDETFIHPSALATVAKDGKIIRYVYGSFIPGDIDMAIVDAAKGTPSLSVKRLLEICFGSDPNANKSLIDTVKISVLIVFIGGLAIFVLYIRKLGRRSVTGDGRKE